KAGYLPVHYAAHYSKLDCLRFLMKQGTALDAKNHGNTVGHYASEGGKADCLNCYLQHGGRLDIENNNGDTPLDTAKRSGHPLLMQQAGG
ncbi:hypothetical protein LOTGIDRAFT_128109, partial [Lottia gigantea]